MEIDNVKMDFHENENTRPVQEADSGIMDFPAKKLYSIESNYDELSIVRKSHGELDFFRRLLKTVPNFGI